MGPDPSSSWIAAARTVRIDEVAVEADLTVLGHGYLDRCPACAETRRSAHDQRIGAARLTVATGLWCCYRCGVGGGAVELVVAVLFATRKLPAGDPRWPEVRAWFAQRGWCAPGRGAPPPRPIPRPPPPTLPTGDVWPPRSEVVALWEACSRLGALGVTHPARRYLDRHRHLNLDRLDALDIVRVIPTDFPWPAWMPIGRDRDAWLSVYLLVVPLFDEAGELRSIRCRAVDRLLVPDPAGAPRLVWELRAIDARRKALNARGYTCAGLVLADPMATAVLGGRDHDDGVGWDGRIVVTEGEPDFWTWSVHAGRGPAICEESLTFAVIGIGSGGWSDAIAARVPDGATVILRTHHDLQGEAYARRVADSLGGRAAVHRAPKPGGASR